MVFVTRHEHMYLSDIEEKEEGGTPAIIESIRAGLVFQLKEAIGIRHIEEREHFYTMYVLSILLPDS